MAGGHEPLGDDGPLRVERFDDRVVATLNRPDKRNAIDQATIDALHVLCAELEAIPRILILTGAGGVFASGADIAELRERRADDARRGINANAFVRVADLPMPVIAALDGYALGGGAELAYAADIRIATPRLQHRQPRDRPRHHRRRRRELAPAGDRRRGARDRAAAHRPGDRRRRGAATSGSSSSCTPPTSCCRPRTRSPTGSRATTAPPRSRRSACSARRAPTHPAVDLEAQAALFESPEKQRRMTEFLERKPK